MRRAALSLAAAAAFLGLMLWAAAPPLRPGRAAVTPRPAGLSAPAAPAGRTAPLPMGPAPAGLTPQGPASLPPASTQAQPNRFFEPARFYQGLEWVKAHPAPRGQGVLVGGLTCHHALAGLVLSQLFVEVGEQPPETVIVVAPNHENLGQRVITGRRAWATDFGAVEADQALIDRLAGAGLADVDDRALEAEHSIGALMPYLKYHAPDATVVPLILHKDVSQADIRRLAEFIAPLLGPKRLLIASVDFSHYLTRAEAEANDAVTMKAIQDFDLDTLWRMGSGYLDSPPALGLLMLAMQAIGAEGPELAAHTNSGVLLGSDTALTTSYFTFKFRLTGP